jgi:AcrR family transcriptional regulator
MARSARPNPARPTTPPAPAHAGSTPAAEARPRGRPPVISKERLLEVAREVFLEHGFRATTSEVAMRAGIAEGTIFHRFKSKDELFRAAMQVDPDRGLAFVESVPSRAGSGDVRTTLVEFAAQFLEMCRIAVPVMMMSWSNPESELRSDEKGERYRRVVGAIRSFFEAEAALGRLRAKDPEVLARMLLACLHHYCMSELLTRDVGGLTSTRFVEAVVDVIMDASRAPAGGAGEPEAARGSTRRRRT